MTVTDIMDSIGDDIDVGTKPLDAGLSNTGRVNMSNAEDGIPGEDTDDEIRRAKELFANS